MARSADPLRRDEILQQARGVEATITAPVTNPALQLAGALRDISPEVNRTLDGIAVRGKEAADARAQRDVLIANGAKLGDAVRTGKIEATQNPWYVQTYNRESAAVRGQSALSKLQVESATWPEKNDPVAFEKRWREEVGALTAGNFTSKDEIAGFAPIEAQTTQQALQSNTSQNITRIATERDDNASQLLANDLARLSSTHGGVVTADQAGELFVASRTAYTAVGGTEAQWNKLATGAIVTAAHATQNDGLLDLSHAPEIVHGPSGLGTSVEYGNGVDGSNPEAHPVTPLPEGPVAADAVASNPAGRIPAPVQGGRVTGNFGDQRPGHKHAGTDIAVPVGTSVVSPGAGTVVKVARSKNAGNYVTVDLGGGYTTTFMHLSQVNVTEGQKVDASTQVALSGGAKGAPGSGDSTGPHVHWEVRHNGTPVDPRSAHFDPTQAPAPAASAPPAVAQSQDTPALAIPQAAAPGATPVRGPSLYDIAGNAEEIETARFRIQQARENAQTSRLRALTVQEQVEGHQGYDALYAAHGTKLLTGDVPPANLVKELSDAGYRPQAIAQALRLVRGDLQDNAGIASARMAIRGSDPTHAKQIMDLHVEAATQGLTPGMADRVGGMVLRGEISGEDGGQIITTATQRDRQLVEQGRQDENYQHETEQRLGEASLRLRDYQGLQQSTTNVAALVVSRMTGAGGEVTQAGRSRINDAVVDAANGWLQTHPGDFAGARAAARNAGAALIHRFNQSRQPTARARPASDSTGGASSESNPLRK